MWPLPMSGRSGKLSLGSPCVLPCQREVYCGALELRAPAQELLVLALRAPAPTSSASTNSCGGRQQEDVAAAAAAGTTIS